MSISIQCPNPACEKTSVTSLNVTGRRVRCKQCGQSFIATSPGTIDTNTNLPTLIGRFQIRAKLGSGAFGVVYRAYDPQLDRDVALKVSHAAVLSNPRFVERSLREAKSSAWLRHPHIVQIFDAGKDGDRYFIASAFIDGKELSDTLSSKLSSRRCLLCRQTSQRTETSRRGIIEISGK